jgi:hypothetical protein
VLALGLVASIPIIAAAVGAVAHGWVPTGDRAYFAVRAFDVFSSRSPLVGPWSSGATAAAGQVVYSPGPLIYWLLAIPARFLDPSTLQVTSGLVNVASVIGMLGLAYRRGGMALLYATALAVPLMTASLPGETHSDLWNSSAPLFPFALLVFVCWSLACGEYRLLPLAVVVASFAAETHLTFAIPVLGALLVGVVGLALARPFRGGEKAGRWVAIAVVAGLVCWSAPLLDQVVHSPGNLSLLADAATSSEPTLGTKAGWHALVHTIGIPPWWLQSPPSAIERIVDLGASPSKASAGSAALMLLALAGVTLLGFRRKRADLWAAGALGLVLSASVALDTASTPRAAFTTVDYTLRWASPAGMCVWLLLGWSLVTLLPIRAPALGRLAAPAAVAVVAAAGIAVAIGAEARPEPYRAMRTIGDRLEREVPDSGTTRVDGTSFDALAFKAGAVYVLRRAGRDVVATGAGSVLGSDYEPSKGFDRLLRIDADKPSVLPAADGGQRIARLDFHDQERVVIVTLLSAP